MPAEMQTITTTADYHVVAAEQLIFTNQLAFVLSQSAPSREPPHLWLSGRVEVVMTSASAVGASGIAGIIINNTWDGGPTVTVDPGATLKVSASGGGATGYFGGGSAAPRFDNAGTVLVSADGSAQGLVNWVSNGVLTNSGQVTVTSTTSDAVGLKTGHYGSQVLNSGIITVTGRGQVIGVDMGASGTRQVFHNTGTIVARAVGATPSVGVFWGNGPQPGLEGSFINDGTIEADRALDVQISYGTAAENLIVNNGRLIGAVWLGGGAAETLVNNGVIDGLVRMIGAESVYDGRGGTALGPIVGSNNGGNTFLGGAGPETMTGGLWNDTISGGGGDDLIDGGNGANKLDGGSGVNTLSFATVSSGVLVDLAAGTARRAAGADTISGFARVEGSRWGDTIGGAGGDDYLRGADGNDSIEGAAGLDDINGNMGNDTLAGGVGDDWVVGGKDNDVLLGGDGSDIVFGNLGNDTCEGGADLDLVRGGQGDDVLSGGGGGDYLSGDRGNDTITGGTGADFFHTFSDAGIDRVLDSTASDGDRVMLDPGTAYTVSQVGADVVIDMGSGNQMILVGVQQSTLPFGWIFESWTVPW